MSVISQRDDWTSPTRKDGFGTTAVGFLRPSLLLCWMPPTAMVSISVCEILSDVSRLSEVKKLEAIRVKQHRCTATGLEYDLNPTERGAEVFPPNFL